ncbi:small subunit of replication factor C [Hamiltosporidium magnivora]|uniref:Small subunit of replication factor C n=1 Tax=Hamiltosporidium magnivora TaxID=148818 RepID=A0A4V2JUK0_9MICR|nr:small subunit of replication factor C [Hamiltosporidium magnivora]
MNNTLWTEKYRPKTVESFEGPEYLKKFIKNTEENSFPNLLLYGPPGTGKTTFAHLLIKKDFMELNASDERGIGVVRNKIKVYAAGISNEKTIILDECDSLTNDAQQCLRRIIEDHSKTTRFIFITNYLSKIISPLKSRLLKIKFECKKENVKYLKKIGKLENLDLKEEIYDKIFLFCKYDLRRSVNLLQGIHPLVNENIDFDEYMGIIPKNVINKFFSLRRTNEIKYYVDEFIRNGYSLYQFLFQLADACDGKDEERCMFYKELSLIESRAVLGCSTEILLYSLCCKKLEIY